MKQLPARPDLSHLRKQAKELLRALRAGEPDATKRVGEVGEPRLARAQLCIAREYGFHSWTELKTYVETKNAESDRSTLLKQWLQMVYGGMFVTVRPGLAMRLLEDHSDLLGDDPILACAVGDETSIRRALNSDPTWLNRRGGPLFMRPLIAVTFSSMIKLPAYEDKLRHCARLLLDRGADPNLTWTPDEFPTANLGALYGAAGHVHDPELTKVMLAAGADPNDNESLYHSLEGTDLECTKLLLNAGAKVSGTNALFHALDYDNLEAVRLLLAHGGDANEESEGLGRPLHHAIRRRRSIEHIELLLAYGADPTAEGMHGISAYRLALYYGMPEAAVKLRAGGAKEEISIEDRFLAACAGGDRNEARRIQDEQPDIMNRLSEWHLKQLPNLAAAGARDAVKLMVEMGWPVATRGGDWDASALNLTVFRGDPELTSFLLEHGSSWTERHGYNDNVVGTLSFASGAEPVKGGEWLACARTLVEHGMPVPQDDHQFSEEIEAYFDEARNAQSAR